MMRKAQIRWAGHVSRMADSRIPKQLFYGQLKNDQRKIGVSRKRYKDYYKSNLKDFNIDITAWEKAASDRPAWCRLISNGALLSEGNRLNSCKIKTHKTQSWRRCTRETSHTLVPNMRKRFSGANRSDQPNKNTQVRAILSLFHLIYFYSFNILLLFCSSIITIIIIITIIAYLFILIY